MVQQAVEVKKEETNKNYTLKGIQDRDLFSNFSISIALFVGFQILNRFHLLDSLKSKFFYSYSVFYILQMMIYIAASSISIVNLISLFISSQNWGKLIFSKLFGNSHYLDILSQIPINKINMINYSDLRDLVDEDPDAVEKYPDPSQLHNFLLGLNFNIFSNIRGRKISSINTKMLNPPILITPGRLASPRNAEKLSSNVKKSIFKLIIVLLIAFFCYSISIIYSNLIS
ncbi:MAG: hypothetical protein ACTSWX_00845 [Promethearchaeota archaeon]